MKNLLKLTALLCTTFSAEAAPQVAIANYGPHASLEKTIQGFKDELKDEGFTDISYSESQVNFEQSLIPQMITKLAAEKPDVMLVVTTPVAEAAAHKIKSIPLVFSAISDPVSAGLLKTPDQPGKNITGASEIQDLGALLEFARRLIPHAKKVGMLYAVGESNDKALLEGMKTATQTQNLELVAIGVDHARNVGTLMKKFKGKVDFIYVGTSGPIQPSLPTIASQAKAMRIPVINADSDAVKQDLVLASFGVSYEKMGRNAGKIAGHILNGKPVSEIPPIHPAASDHEGYINLKVLKELNLELPKDLTNTTVIE